MQGTQMAAIRKGGNPQAFWKVSATDPHTGQRGTFFGRDLAHVAARARAWLEVRRATALCERLEAEALELEERAQLELELDQIVAALIDGGRR